MYYLLVETKRQRVKAQTEGPYHLSNECCDSLDLDNHILHCLAPCVD